MFALNNLIYKDVKVIGDPYPKGKPYAFTVNYRKDTSERWHHFSGLSTLSLPQRIKELTDYLLNRRYVDRRGNKDTSLRRTAASFLDIKDVD